MQYVSVQGVDIPALGLGTWQITGEECREAVEHALSSGYRHIDTAQGYGNEDDVGTAIARSDVPRDDIFLTTKIWHTQTSYDAAGRSIDDSLSKLGTDYVDLLLIHWPTDVPVEDTLEAMADAREAGKVRHIGVSNFTPTLVEEALEHEKLLCNQVEYHPFLSQDRLLEQARDNDMMLTAYSPLARGQAVNEDLLIEIGEEYGKSPAQVALRWLIQQDNVAAIPKAASAAHREANLDIFDFELSADQMQQIRQLDRGERIIDPSFAPHWER